MKLRRCACGKGVIVSTVQALSDRKIAVIYFIEHRHSILCAHLKCTAERDWCTLPSKYRSKAAVAAKAKLVDDWNAMAADPMTGGAPDYPTRLIPEPDTDHPRNAEAHQ